MFVFFAFSFVLLNVLATLLFFEIYLNALNFRGQLPFTGDDDDVLAEITASDTDTDSHSVSVSDLS